MKPLYDYIVIEEIVESKTTNFTVQTEEPTFCVGKVVAINVVGELSSIPVGTKVLFKKYGFDEYRGQLIGKIEHIIATL